MYNDNFLEASWLRWSAKSKDDAKICIMGIPFDNAVSLNKGTSKGPETLRLLSTDLSDTTEAFHPISDGILYDAGDVPVDLNWERYFSNVESKARDLMKTDNFCLFLGGDHSVTIPLHKAFFAYQKEKNPDAKIGVIHFDAHYDLCPEYDGHKWSHACTEARALENGLPDDSLHFVGIRVAELSELELLKKHPAICTESALDIFDHGWKSCCQALTSHFKDYDAVYVTLDIDVLDPAYAPGTGTPVAGGLSSRQLIEIMKHTLKTIPVKAMDIVEVSPPLDVNNITSWAALRIIHEIFHHFSI